jgi:hypothetical protein
MTETILPVPGDNGLEHQKIPVSASQPVLLHATGKENRRGCKRPLFTVIRLRGGSNLGRRSRAGLAKRPHRAPRVITGALAAPCFRSDGEPCECTVTHRFEKDVSTRGLRSRRDGGE